MTNYVYFSNLIKKGLPQEFINRLLIEVLEITLPAKTDYPGYETWFLEKFVPGLFNGTRDIVLAIKNGKIIGVANLKKDAHEKKICTLYIKPKYQKRKEGILLVERSFDFLETTKPLITMPISKAKDFLPIIQKYNWNLSEKIDSYYKENVQELIFNSETSPLTITDSLPEVLEKIYRRKWNSNMLKLKYRSYKNSILYLFIHKKST